MDTGDTVHDNSREKLNPEIEKTSAAAGEGRVENELNEESVYLINAWACRLHPRPVSFSGNGFPTVFFCIVKKGDKRHTG